MTTSNPARSTRLTPAATGAFIRKALKEAFPGVKFSVRMSRGTAYGSYSVNWTDGPSYDEVREVTRVFVGKTFDGMTDMAGYRDAFFTSNGVRYESGAGFVQCQRDVSDTAMADAIVAIFAEGYNGEDYAVQAAARRVASGEKIWSAAHDARLTRD